MTSYCATVRNKPLTDPHRIHHDLEHGWAPQDDDDLFRRFVLEILQAGLSFDTIIKKKASIHAAFPDIATVSAYTSHDTDRLMHDEGIIRNRLKIRSIIHNANAIREIVQTHGSFIAFLDAHHPSSLPVWVRLLKQRFSFVGPEIVNEFLMSARYLPGAHDPDCPIEARIQQGFKP